MLRPPEQITLFRILYIGDDLPGSTSANRFEALIRLDYSVLLVNPNRLIRHNSPLLNSFHYKTGYFFLQSQLTRELKKVLKANRLPIHVVWVNSGEMLGASLLKWIRSFTGAKIILYQNDDPTGLRDSEKFLTLRAAIPFYDLFVSVRSETTTEALALGSQRALRTFTSYDEILHTSDQNDTDKSPKPVVSFVGTLIPGEQRDHFLLALMQAGLPLRFSGNLWNRSRLWPVLQEICEGPALLGAAYSKAIRKAAVSLGLLSHQNRDLITRRSFEIPAYGGLLCGERSSEHQLFFEDGHEAMFWLSNEECISQCINLLDQTELSSEIRKNGSRLVSHLGVGNEDICRQVMASI